MSIEVTMKIETIYNKRKENDSIYDEENYNTPANKRQRNNYNEKEASFIASTSPRNRIPLSPITNIDIHRDIPSPLIMKQFPDSTESESISDSTDKNIIILPTYIRSITSPAAISEEISTESHTYHSDFKPVISRAKSFTGTVPTTQTDIFSPSFTLRKSREQDDLYEDIYCQYEAEKTPTKSLQRAGSSVGAHSSTPTRDRTPPLRHIKEEIEEESLYIKSNIDTTLLKFELTADEVLDNGSDEEAEATYCVEEVIEEEFDPFLFISNLPPLPYIHLTRPPLLPPKAITEPKITLVLDLDETLVHCSTEYMENYDYKFPVTFNDTNFEVHAKVRPFFDQFLDFVSNKFEVIIFTASQKVYANKLLDILDPQNRIRYRLFRDACVVVDGNYLKDLHILNRDISKVIIVDNSPQAFGYQLDNGIPITSWFDDPTDTELNKLTLFLDKLSNHDDVRPVIRSVFKLQEYVESAKANVVRLLN